MNLKIYIVIFITYKEYGFQNLIDCSILVKFANRIFNKKIK